MNNNYFVYSFVAALVTAGCGSSDDGSADAMSTTMSDAMAQETDGGMDMPDAMAATGARLVGAVTRTTNPEAGGDAIGNLYVAVFDRDPVANMGSAVMVGQAYIEGADLSAANASLPYEVLEIPPRAEPYYVFAFLDDDLNVDPADPNAAGPDRGDLASLNGLSSPQVTIAAEGDTMFDIALNFVMPF